MKSYKIYLNVEWKHQTRLVKGESVFLGEIKASRKQLAPKNFQVKIAFGDKEVTNDPNKNVTYIIKLLEFYLIKSKDNMKSTLTTEPKYRLFDYLVDYKVK